MTTLRTDLNTGVSQSTASRSLRQFTRAINSRAHEIIRFPVSKSEVEMTMRDFRSIAGKKLFPLIIFIYIVTMLK